MLIFSVLDRDFELCVYTEVVGMSSNLTKRSASPNPPERVTSRRSAEPSCSSDSMKYNFPSLLSVRFIIGIPIARVCMELEEALRVTPEKLHLANSSIESVPEIYNGL